MISNVENQENSDLNAKNILQETHCQNILQETHCHHQDKRRGILLENSRKGSKNSLEGGSSDNSLEGGNSDSKAYQFINPSHESNQSSLEELLEMFSLNSSDKTTNNKTTSNDTTPFKNSDNDTTPFKNSDNDNHDVLFKNLGIVLGSTTNIAQLQLDKVTKRTFLTENLDFIQNLENEVSLHEKLYKSLQNDVSRLEKRIALLLSFQKHEIKASKKTLSNIESVSTLSQTMDPIKYNALFYCLLQYPQYLARLLPCCISSPIELDFLLKFINGTLYKNQDYSMLALVQLLMQQEFKQASSFASVLRANSSTSKLMTSYTKRPDGRKYLENLLAPITTQILQLSERLDLEIDPIKVYNYLVKASTMEQYANGSKLDPNVSYETASSHPDVKALIRLRSETIMEICASILGILFSDINSIPFGNNSST